MEPINIREILDIEMPKEAETSSVIIEAAQLALKQLGYTIMGIVVAHKDSFGPQGGHVQSGGHDPVAAAIMLLRRYGAGEGVKE